MIASWIRAATRTREENRVEFERHLKNSYRQAYGLAVRLTGNPSEAEDLVQETFVRAYRFFHRYDRELPFTSWLYRIMTNLHIDQARRRSRMRTVSLESSNPEGTGWDIADAAPTAEATLLSETLDENFQLGLQAMNPEFRTAVLLSDVEGLSYEEVAEVMETSVGTVRSRIHRGRKQLRDYLGIVAVEMDEEASLA